MINKREREVFPSPWFSNCRCLCRGGRRQKETEARWQGSCGESGEGTQEGSLSLCSDLPDYPLAAGDAHRARQAEKDPEILISISQKKGRKTVTTISGLKGFGTHRTTQNNRDTADHPPHPKF